VGCAKNGWTDRDTVWDVDSGGSKEACVIWGAHWRHLANTIEASMCGSDAAFCIKLLWPLVMFADSKNIREIISKSKYRCTFQIQYAEHIPMLFCKVLALLLQYFFINIANNPANLATLPNFCTVVPYVTTNITTSGESTKSSTSLPCFVSYFVTCMYVCRLCVCQSCH